MNKLDLESKNLVDTNIELIAQLFPHCITEQDGKNVIDFEKLKNEFSDNIADDTKEKYELNWPGKRKAINEARIKTNKTLLPLKNKSVNFEDTNNVYIEGDNLEVLKLLQESYLNKIKCIYIDPPYNTGKDFIYKDDFKQTSEEELIESGQVDKDGNKFVQNTETNGRYHSDWLSMMYPRLKLARNLLKFDGLIFISIGEDEYSNLKVLCDEVFGDSNQIGTFIWQQKKGGGQAKHYYKGHEYIFCYAKNKSEINGIYSSNTNQEGWVEAFRKVHGKYSDNPIFKELLLKYPERINNHRSIFYEEIDILIEEGLKQKKFKYEVEEGLQSGDFRLRNISGWHLIEKPVSEEKKMYSIYSGVRTEHGNIEQQNLMGAQVFDNPKPVTLLNDFLSKNIKSSDYVLDFFSGSSTTAHSILDLNASDVGNRKYIMVQLPETIDEKNSKVAYDFCVENDLEPIIPSIAQERIKRAGAKIKEETGADIDYGFRVFKLSNSILKANKVLPNELQQELLFESDSKYVDGISKLDIVTSIILDLGLMLDSKIKELDNDNFVIEEDLLFISLSEVYDKSILDSICDIMPDQVVLDEKTFDGNDALMTNVIQQIKEINSDITINIL